MIAIGSARLRRALAITVAVAALFTAFVATFDWNWLRGPVERYLANKSGRDVRLGSLQVEHALSLSPTVRLRDVYVENAAWASSKEPLAVAREMAFTVALPTIFGDHVIVSRIEVADARMDMERREDGLRNWRLRDPEDRSQGRIQVQTLVARRSELRFSNASIDLSLQASISDAPDPASSALPSRLRYQGRYRGRAFNGEAQAGAVLSFRKSDVSFPLRGHLEAAGTRLDFDGTASDVFEPASIDVRMRLAGPTLSEVYPFLRIRAPESRPYALEAHLVERHGIYKLQHVTGHLGGTRGTADVTYDRSGNRRRLDATLHSDAAVFDDVSPLIGLASRGTATRSGGGLLPGGGPGAGKSPRPLPFDALRSLDARVVATAKRLTIERLPPLADARVEGTLDRGVMSVKPISYGIAGGSGSGEFTLDVRESVAVATVTAQLRTIRIEQLVPALARDNRAAALVSGTVKLDGRGASASEIASGMRGTLDARIDSGRLSQKLDAKLGLDYGKFVKLFFTGDHEIPIRCGAVGLDLRDGVARTRSLAVDTADTRVTGRGSIDLRKQRVDILLDPAPKDPSLFAKRRSIRVAGPLGSPQVSLGDPVAIAATSC